MDYLFKNCKVYRSGSFVSEDICVSDNSFVSKTALSADAKVVDCDKYFIFPGFVDVHVHLRQPGFLYKETIATGTAACAHGGYTDVCSMPNLNPTPDCAENLKLQLDAIKADAVINVHPYGTITKGEKGEELSEMEEIAQDVVAFSDDGRGVQSDDMMLDAMSKAKSLGKMIVAHCEDNRLLKGGYIHDGEYAATNGHRGICSESEWGPISRDVELVKKGGCSYHVCHISTAESVDIIRKAKKNGVDITCETGPHYLLLDDSNLEEHGRFKMNPPLRSKKDREALVEGILDGTIDMIATDHAPHSHEEKSKGLRDSLMGVVGIETAFPIMYTYFVKNGTITMEKLMKLLHYNAAERFGIGSNIEIGNPASFTVFDLDAEYTINPDDFLSKGKSTPFEGWTVNGKCVLTMCNGKLAFSDGAVL